MSNDIPEKKPVTGVKIDQIGNGFLVEWYCPNKYQWVKEFRETYQQARDLQNSLFEQKGE